MPRASKDIINVKGFHLEFGEIDEYLKRKSYYGKRVSVDYDELRKWDLNLLSHFKPFYAPLCDLCCMCTYGKCDLLGKKGACGINLEKQQAREALSTAVIGASAHAAHARHLVDTLIEKKPTSELHYDSSIDIKTPISTTVTGVEPETPEDLDRIMTYIERELTNLMASVHTGQETEVTDFESKALHAGMLDTMALELAEIAQINQYGLPTGKADTHMLEIGMDVIDSTKPVILCIGHNIAPSAEIIDYAEDIGAEEEIEICGLCCTAMEMGRYSKSSKIVGPISRQLTFLRSGIPDVVVLDEQCIRSDVYEVCGEMGMVVIATSDKCSMGLEDMSEENPYRIINRILQEKIPGVLIKDEKKVAMVAVNLALQLTRGRDPETSDRFRVNCVRCSPCDSNCTPSRKPEKQEDLDLNSVLGYCELCGECNRVCPAMLPIMEAIDDAKNGDLRAIGTLYESCSGCGRCMEVCPVGVPILDIIRESRGETPERFLIRAGRGPVQDIEIRRVGAPIVFGDIPGVISLAGCSNYPSGERDVQIIAEEFLKRGYIVLAAGCAAMDIALTHDDEGKTLYEKYPGDFDRGGLLNLGPCVGNSHAIGSAIKIANIFARVPMKGNTVEIADYILNRIGVCVIGWGAMSQKAFAIVTGANRWGIPVVLGPHASKYRRLYLGESSPRVIRDKSDDSMVPSEPAPPHLTYAAESINECLVMASKMCIRPNDTPRGRMVKLSNYVDLHLKYYGDLPADIDLFVRNEREIPYKHKDDILEILRKKNWKPREPVKEPTIIR
ncbi:CO dehydrogenase/acetyl-CoA synthase complex subunit alpha [Methanothermobacter sp. DP]|uniref:CO dehydrogenase/acetyl-CoA synthase complex subunit alpha n=1 Tax=Methanothermobacter sp. DP TaxID=2998972 RepID=UPI002AA56A84|nr:CO dehydrogenase/acetyl-CoA synthase complex subunit alpha [Methanothermobacter sp. DP]